MKPSSHPYLVGISGGSASGKTFLLKKLMERYPAGQITLISQDNYYQPIDLCPKNEEGEVNFDHPDALDLVSFARDIHRLYEGETVKLMEYTFNNPDIVPKELVYSPSPLILVEGLFVFTHPDVARQLNLKIFVDADEHIRLSRRIRRDYAERGYSLDEVLDYYEKFVAPMYRKYIEPYKYECDLILPNNLKIDKAVEVVMHHLDKVISSL